MANLAIERRGSISQAAAGAETSRRVLRETLKRAGTYQPPAFMTDAPSSEAPPKRRRRSSRERAAEVLAKLAKGMTATEITTRGGLVRVCMEDGALRIKIEGESPITAGSHEALRVLAATLDRMGGPVPAQGNKGGTDAI